MLIKIGNHVIDTGNIAHVDLDRRGEVTIALSRPSEYWGATLTFSGEEATSLRKFFTTSAVAGVVDVATAK